MSKERGFFVTFEGGDGVGKSTQIERLAQTLKNRGEDVVVTREPGGSTGAEEIRALLVKGDSARWSAMTELLLVMAARRDHWEKTIEPALKKGAIVLCDRFFDSTMAYQGLAGGLGEAHVTTAQELAIGDVRPDVTFVLTLPDDLGLARTGARDGDETRFEEKGQDFQDRVGAAFLAIAKGNPERCVVIDASDEIEVISTRILGVFDDRRGAHG